MPAGRGLTGLLVVVVVFMLLPASRAAAHQGLGATGQDPVAALATAEDELDDAEQRGEQLTDERRNAQQSLVDERAELEDVVADREAAEVALAAAELAMSDALDAGERATIRLNATTSQLERLVEYRDSEDGKLKVEARETYKEGATGGMAIATVTIDVLLSANDSDDALRTIDMLSRLAARRADEVATVTSLADGVARIQSERAGVLLRAHADYGLAVARRDARDQALEDLRRREKAQTEAVQEARQLVTTLTEARAANEEQQSRLAHEVEDWTAYIASLRTSARRAPVPSDIARYGNGRVPAHALAPIGVGSHRLWGPAAGAFKALRDAAARDGVHIGVTDSYRSYGAQVALAGKKGLYADGGLAARPGSSEHGYGLAVDIDVTGAALRWMRANAGTYGFVENTPREPWHWAFTARPHA